MHPRKPLPTRLSLLTLATALCVPSALAQMAPLGQTGGKRTRAGGGPGATVIDMGATPLNQGALDVGDFDYVDDRPVGFHPLGVGARFLTERNETALVVPGAANWLLEDVDNDRADVVGGNSLFTGNVRSIASGNLDDDAGHEIVAVAILPSGAMSVSMADRTPTGAYEVTHLFDVAQESWPYIDARIGLANFDRDSRDEITLVARNARFGSYGNRAWTRLFDDPVAGTNLIHWTYRGHGHADMEVLAADVDADGANEYAVAMRGDSTSINRVEVELYQDRVNDASMTRIMGWDYLAYDGPSKVVVGDFDGDGIDEFGSVTQDSNGYNVKRWRYNGSELVQVGSTFERHAHNDGNRYDTWDVTAFDRNGNGIDQMAILDRYGSDQMFVTFHGIAPNGSWIYEGSYLTLVVTGSFAATITAADSDADGKDELFFDVLADNGSKFVYSGYYKEHPAPFWDWPAVRPVVSELLPPVSAPGDFDADGLAVEYLGKSLRLADPIPLVLLSAPPTKAGIDQNVDNSSTSYTVASGTSESVGVTNSASISVSVGYESEDPFGAFGASAKATISAELARTSTTTERVTIVQGFSGSPLEDVIIFQGTLYRMYEYVVVGSSRPEDIGIEFSIDEPVGSNVYKWTVPYYNDNVTFANRIGSDVLPHTPGDPASYRDWFEMGPVADRYVSWATGDGDNDMAVGQTDGGTNQIAIELETEQTNEEQRTFEATVESEFKAGGATVGASASLSTTSLYSISVSQTTAFEGVVGDIGNPTDYDNWSYDFGMVVYQNGVLRNANNDPIGNESGKRPYLIVSYWTDLTGSEY